MSSLPTPGGAERWSKSQPVILRIAGESPQTLIADPDAAPEADSYRNKDFEFYSLKTFTTLTHKSHGMVVKFYNDCRVDSPPAQLRYQIAPLSTVANATQAA